MTSSDTNNVRPRGSWIRILLFLVGLLLLSAVPAHADNCVASHGGLIDGFVNPVPPANIQIDGNCTFRNFPASNALTTNISFFGPLTGALVIFDNVDFIGNIACDKVHVNALWFVNGSITTVRPNCQNLIKVSAPTSTYVAGESLLIPPTSDASTAPFSVPTCPGSSGDALPAIPYCEAQVSEFAPPPSVAARSAGTRYYLNLTLRFRVRLPEIDDVRNPLIAHAAIGSQEEHGCSKEHAL